MGYMRLEELINLLTLGYHMLLTIHIRNLDQWKDFKIEKYFGNA